MSDFERLGQRVAREQDVLRARSSARAQVRERLRTLELSPARGTRRLSRAATGGAAFALAAAAAVFVLWTRTPQSTPAALELHVGTSKEPVRAGAWVEAPSAGEGLLLQFSDGTRIDVAPRTRM